MAKRFCFLLSASVFFSLSFFEILLNVIPDVRIEYLPPYLPDFNPIEEAFSKIKAFIRRNNDIFAASIGAGLIYDMKIAMEIITPWDAQGYFMHAGYF